MMTLFSSRMPAVFFGHGSPMNALQDNRYTAAWRRLAANIARPRAILSVSAHWLTHGTAVTAMEAPRTIHDFGSFPQALFDMQYPAPGDPALAERIRALLVPEPVELDYGWGMDHGTWSVLCQAYPEAVIPVLQLSIDANRSYGWHREMGKRLAALRNDGVLIMGTGNVVHNLLERNLDGDRIPHAWATRFNDRVRESLLQGDLDSVLAFRQWGMDASLSVPTDDHFLPLFYILGCRVDDETFSIEIDGVERGSISMLTAVVGGTGGALVGS